MDSAIVDLYAEAECWHGTGRYKYGPDGKVVDILQQLIKDGGLVPHEDDWDQKRGKVQSISLAKQRMYAKLYALMHMPGGARLAGEHRSRYLWGYYFFGTAKLVALGEYGLRPHVPDYWRKIRTWTAQVSREPRSLQSVFLKGSDISGNYPILIGVRQGAVKFHYGSHFFNLHERRTEQPIPFSDMTHIEVPAARIEETRALLRAAGTQLPILSMETGEAYCRQFSFWQLVNGRALVL